MENINLQALDRSLNQAGFWSIGVMSLSVLSIVLFCVCCYFFTKTILQPIPLFSATTGYSKTALRIKKSYNVVAWGIMTAVFLMALVVSFTDVFTQL